MKRKTYLDTASTTPLDKRVLRAMAPYWRVDFGNPSSIHAMGVTAKNAVATARKTIAKSLNAHDREIVFTSGGTEANNLAIFGAVKKQLMAGKKVHAITTEIEHSSILEPFKELKRIGCAVDFLKVNEEGIVNPKDLRDVMRPETAIISIGYANSEIGVVQPIKEIIKEIRHARKKFGRDRVAMPYLHLDACAAMQYENMNVEELGVDFISIDAQKIYGPKGVGALYVKDGVEIEPVMFGGGQEKGLRSGTENVPGIVGFAKAAEINDTLKEKEGKRLAKLLDEFFGKVQKIVPTAIVNGSRGLRLPNNINISIPGEDGEMMVLRLDEKGFVASSSSACASGSGESAVVRTIAEASGATTADVDARAKSALRFTLGRETRAAAVKRLLKILAAICK
ncbi:MAG: cysteine desulfurase [Patescibacteria group bacterium]|nr:cysteine desulfurase [Patescibacteria group bacterium]MDE1946177.1 cysteine desulfurase [Patescibacteria group bacterium]